MNRISELRKKNNITQVKLAAMLGVTQSNLSGWELEKWEPDTSTLKKLCDIFNCDLDYLLGRTNNMSSQQKKPTDETVSFERFSEMLHDKGLSEYDIEKLSTEQLSTIADIIKNFKK